LHNIALGVYPPSHLLLRLVAVFSAGLMDAIVSGRSLFVAVVVAVFFIVAVVVAVVVVVLWVALLGVA